MAYGNPIEGSLKRKRRREDKPAISARIFLDGSLKGEAGVLSADLVEDLYPRSSNEGGWLYAALTPWTPNPSPAECSWCILPFRGQSKEEKQLPPSTIRFPAGAPTTQSFVHLVQRLSPTRTLRQNAPVEVRISDVVPLTLDTVYVSVDSGAITKLEEVQKRFGGGFASANGYHVKRSGKKAQQPEASLEDLNVGEDARRQLVNDALGRLQVVHTGDILPLALIHPVTHAPAPPAKVLACEPVAQGILAAETRVVITSASSDRRQINSGNRALMSPRLDEESEEEDTSNETFYSATEDTPAKPLKPIVVSKSATDFSNTDDTMGSETEDSNLSDDSDDMISLVQPGISDQPSGLSSALTSATPRAFLGNRTGGVSTPGSVYSHMSTSTVRGGQATRSKMFRAQGLLDRVPEALLHPRPASEEDEEARVYVDSNALARLGCFSGDWVKIEAAENSGLPQLSAFGALGGAESQAWRPVKVYGLPEIMSKRPQRYQVNPPSSGRRDSISSLTTTSGATSTLYAPPVLLANLNQPENVSLAPLAVGKRTAMKRPISGRPISAAPKQPPTASEVTLRKIVSPLSSERALSNVLFANLKEHFERRQRIVKAGDLIAIPIDESLGRSLYEGAAEQDDSASSALLAQWQPHSDHKNEAGKVNVSWFTIESVNVPKEDVDTAEEAAAWAGAASIDPTRMTMRQSGDDRRKLPPSSRSTWPYYYGVKTVQPKPAAVSHTVSAMPEVPQGYISALHRRIRELITVSTSPRAVHLGLPPLALLLTSAQRSIGKTHLARTVCADLGIHFFEIDAYDIASEGGQGVDTQAQGLLEARCERALDCGAEFTAICVRHIENLSSDRVAGSLKEVLKRARVLVATTTDVDKISDPVRGLFTHELEMSAPDEGEREGILRDVASQSGIPLALDVDLAAVAVKTAALVAGDLVDVVERAVVARTERLTSLATAATEQVCFTVTMKDIQLSGGAAATSLIAADFDAAVDLARKNFADAIGAPKIPNVQWSDVGGLTHVKDAVVETIQLPLSRPELFAKGLKKRSGILFYGPPGTGKTLLAKAIATEFSLNFFSVKGPELLNMYIGESEANVRRVFQRARDARPCVVFFDELDSVAPKRGNQGDSGGVMDRIVSQLLAELDGMSDGEESGGGVFVIGATNRPDLLDQALLRPGRFDKMLYLGISDTHEKQATILQALTRKFTLDPSLSLARVAASLPFTFTGADLYALCSDAMLKAVTRSARLVDEKLAAINAERGARGQTRASVAYYFDHHATDADTAVAVTEEDFVLARRELVPSGAGKKEEEGGRDGAGQVVDGGDEVPAVNGVARGVGEESDGDDEEEEEDDDFVIRTDRLAVNGGVGVGMGKGKGKGVVGGPTVVDGGDGEGEDLYD
ncbi:ATPase family associated with various cellular activities (AAA) [Teratosphaeria destructans]|uniref:Peroxisomal ATPase PEX6 n=1 Tax=Teratosphaeria destructans TaxID=418781 RepID=A0A9W7SNH8_9PEZI|nr:ATPase family associated with various cellular activities (AAA) [Teratosphaeria destructans]